MKIKINVDEIEFANGRKGKAGEIIKFTFHDQIRIKKAFEKELTRLLLLETKVENSDSLLKNLITNEMIFKSNESQKISIKEISRSKFSWPAGRIKDPFLVGRELANSIYSSLNMINNSARNAKVSNNLDDYINIDKK